MRRVTPVDLPSVTAFLKKRMIRAMFPLSNLARYGLDGEHDYAPSMWVSEDATGITGVLTVGRSGVVMPCLPSLNWDDATAVLSDLEVSGFIGPTDEVRPLIENAKLSGVPTSLDRDEPQFELALENLSIPDGPGELVPLDKPDMEEMIRWRADYSVEALGQDRDVANTQAVKSYEAYVAADTHRVLVLDGVPLSTTGFNARIPEMVQIGGVYTPPNLRGNGYARRAVALHLKEAREQGARRATLFSASESAARAYSSIGFQPIGKWSLCLFEEKVSVSG